MDMHYSTTTLHTEFSTQTPRNRFYRTVWRWHFYAGLFVIPFMLMLAITGIVYLFKPQLDAAMYHNLMFVSPETTQLSYTNQVQRVEAAYPGATVTQVTPNSTPERSTEVLLHTSDGRNLMVFINPHSGILLGSRDEDSSLQAIASRMHGELLIGRLGDYLVELAASWGLVLLISGLYLWLPRRLTLFGTLIPRLWSKNQRIVWRDLHAVPGFYGVLLVGFLILTGLPWTGFWGETFAQVWAQFPTQLREHVPQSTILTGSLNQHHQTVPWAVEQLPIPQSSMTAVDDRPTYRQVHLPPAAVSVPVDTSVNLDTIVELAQVAGVPPGFSVTLPATQTGVFTVAALTSDPTQAATLHIDQYSGKVLADIRWQDYGLVPRAVELGIAIHLGQYFGLANQLLMLVAALLVILLSLTGLVLWWQRRPRGSGQIGAPAMPPYRQHWQIPLVIVAILGLALPLMGLSLVSVLLLDYLMLSRLPGLKRIFN